MTKRLRGIPNLPFAPIVAVLFGVVAAILVFATPAWLLERTVGSLGISSFISAAKPPLGTTARALMALSTGLGTAGLLWLIMRPIERLIHKRRTAPGFATAATAAVVPVAEQGARAPIFAGDELGAPLMSDEALASGEELFLNAAMVEAPAPAADPAPVFELTELEPPFAEEQVLDLQGFNPEPLDLTPAAFSPAPEPVAFEEVAPTIDWPVPAEPAPVALSWPEPVAEFVAPEVATPEVAAPRAAEADMAEGETGGSIEFVSADAPPAPVFEMPPFPAPQPVAFETAGPEPVSLNWPVTEPVAEPVAEAAEGAAPAPLAEPQIAATSNSSTEPSLQDLLRRFESALDRRQAQAAQGHDMPEPMAFGTVASLRSLIESSNKDAA